tara:strand:+ start:102 stop:1031 length:930 start_codon:yes stop_codon:yes gene_type:complete
MDYTIWKNFVSPLNESFGDKLQSDMDDFLKKGSKKASKGSPFRGANYNFKGKNRNQVSAPPGAAGGGALEEIDVDKSGFEVHDELEPQIWEDEKLNPEISERLKQIAQDFVDGLDIPVEIEDITLTGSLANYNWSKYSDVDLHIIVDFSKIDEDTKLVKSFFDGVRMRWNIIHDIKIKGYDVEIYVENTGEDHISTGIYSIMNDKWIVEPKVTRKDIDFETAKKKAEDIEDRYKRLSKMLSDEKYDQTLSGVDRVKQKIRDMRSAGLESDMMEFSAENIAFKILRRAKILDDLSKLKYDAYDKSMTMDD